MKTKSIKKTTKVKFARINTNSMKTDAQIGKIFEILFEETANELKNQRDFFTEEVVIMLKKNKLWNCINSNK